MFGLDLISLPAAYMLVAMGGGCDEPQQPSIRVTQRSEKPRYNYSKSERQLADFDIDTKSPYSSDRDTKIGGLMAGEITVETNVDVSWSTNRSSGDTCMWIDKVRVKVIIQPTIYVANGHPVGSCQRRAVLEHEHKHVKADQEVANAYLRKYERALKNLFFDEPVIGPFDSDDVPDYKEELMEKVEDTVNDITQDMHKERRKLQQSIDSRSEYDRVSEKCDGEW